MYYKQYSPDFIVALFLCFIYFLCLCAGLSATVRRANSFTKKGAWGFGFLFILYQISCVVGGSDSSGIWLMNIIANLVLLFYPPNKDEKHNLS